MTSWKKKLLLIWIGETFSAVSSAIVQFAVIWWITKETGSSRVLAYASISAFLPQALLSPFIGVLVDRWDKKKILIFSDIAIAVFSALLGILYHYDLTELWQIYTILALRSISNTFYTPALQATIPLLAPKEQFMRIAAINQLIQAVGNTAGPALGALFVLWFDMVVIVNFDVLGAVIACCLLACIRIPRTTSPQQSSPHIIRELKEGLQTLANHRGIAMLIYLSALFYFIFMPANALYPLLVFNHFKGGAIEMGIIEFVFGMCMILGGILLGVWTIPIRKAVLINIAYLGMGIPLAISGLLPATGIIPFIILFGIFGFFVPWQSSPLTALIQADIEPRLLGRVFALMGTLSILPALSLAAVGFLADHIGVSNTFFFSGVGIGIIGIAGFFIPSVMNLEKKPPR